MSEDILTTRPAGQLTSSRKIPAAFVLDTFGETSFSTVHRTILTVTPVTTPVSSQFYRLDILLVTNYR